MQHATFIAFFVYLSIVIGFAIAAWFVTRNLSDFVLGGRSLSGAIAALSSGASDMSAWLLMGLPGAVFRQGLHAMWLPIGLVVGAYLNWRFVGTKLRIYSEAANNALTIPAFLSERFQDKTRVIQIIAAFSKLIFFAFYSASGLVAAAVLMQKTFGLDYYAALFAGASIIMLYTLVGGFLAVSWTDFFQGTMMLFCLLAVPFFAVHSIGGWQETMTIISAKGHRFLNPFTDVSLLSLINLLAWGMGYFGQPHILVRFMAVKSAREIPIARRICVGWMSFSMLGAMLCGLIGIAYFQEGLSNPETVFIHFASALYHPWVAGFILAAILSSSMCAIDSQMLASSSALTEDIYHAFIHKNATQRELVWVGRASVVVIASIAIGIAALPQNTVLDLVAFAWAGLASTFAIPVVFSLFYRKTTRHGVIFSMLFGILAVIVWKLTGLSNTVYEIIPGIGCSLTGMLLGNLSKAGPSTETLQLFDDVTNACKGSDEYA